MAMTRATAREPSHTRSSRRLKTCSFRSSMAAQIHMAGRTCKSDSRQSENSNFTPWNSITRAPMAKVSGARYRFDRLSCRTACSTRASSPSLMARISAGTCPTTTSRRGSRAGRQSGAGNPRRSRCRRSDGGSRSVPTPPVPPWRTGVTYRHSFRSQPSPCGRSSVSCHTDTPGNRTRAPATPAIGAGGLPVGAFIGQSRAGWPG